MITYADVTEAHERLKNVAHHTPVMTSRTADEAVEGTLFFKCENFQRTGSFKFRGAYNAITQLSEKQRKGGVIAFSSGNHSQAIALSARLHNTHSVILMPADAPEIKINATRGYGAEVVFYNRYTEDRETIAQRLAGERGLTLIPSYNDPHVIAGQGTAAGELFEDSGGLDMLIVPIGGGGLLSGCAIAARHLNPECVVIGIEPEAGNDAQQSFRSGTIVHINPPRTIADGAATQHIGKLTLPIILKYVDKIITVSDSQIIAAMKFLAVRMKIIAEPTGCLAAAAVLSGIENVKGKRVGIMVSGGNVDLLRFAALVQT